MKFYDLLLTLQLRVIGEETSCVVALLLPIKFNKLRLISSLGNDMHVFEVYSLLKWARLMVMSATYKSGGYCLSGRPKLSLLNDSKGLPSINLNSYTTV